MNTQHQPAHAIPPGTHATVSYKLHNYMWCLANWEKTTSNTFLLFSLSLSSDLFMFLKYCLRCLGFKARRAGLCSLLILPLACKLFLSGFKYNLSYVYDIICNIYDDEPGVAILRSCFVFESIPAFRSKQHFPESSRQENHACNLSQTGSGYRLSRAERGSQLILCSCGARRDVKRVCVLLNV